MRNYQILHLQINHIFFNFLLIQLNIVHNALFYSFYFIKYFQMPTRTTLLPGRRSRARCCVRTLSARTATSTWSTPSWSTTRRHGPSVPASDNNNISDFWPFWWASQFLFDNLFSEQSKIIFFTVYNFKTVLIAIYIWQFVF